MSPCRRVRDSVGDSVTAVRERGVAGAIVCAGMTRYQYRIVDLGMFSAIERMVESFGELGAHGWQLVATYDKASNWMTSMENGFAIFIRPVADGEQPEGPWAGPYLYPQDEQAW